MGVGKVGDGAVKVKYSVMQHRVGHGGSNRVRNRERGGRESRSKKRFPAGSSNSGVWQLLKSRHIGLHL